MTESIDIIGGGLAGVEAAWRLARSHIGIRLFEMRPDKTTPVDETGNLAELVCSNSLRAESPSSAVGLLKQEMSRLGSLVIEAALANRVPAGKALAVDRAGFSGYITDKLLGQGNVELIRQEVTSVPPSGLCVLATGPLTSQLLTEDLKNLTGDEYLHFYDAIAPIVQTDSVDMSKAFWASRYAEPEDEADYLNCPMTKDEYEIFYQALMAADKVEPRAFEKAKYFEGCLPIEIMAERGERTLLFGPLKPVGLTNPHSDEKMHAVIQLRKEDTNGQYLNLVGFQTKLTRSAQEKVFRLIPGLENAVFVRMGSIHRNTFVCGPKVLRQDLSLKTQPNVYLAGQITGVEGYVESAACGLMAGEFIRQKLSGQEFSPFPPMSALGALLGHATLAPIKRFQPSNVHFGLMESLGTKMKKRDRGAAYQARAEKALDAWLVAHPELEAEDR